MRIGLLDIDNKTGHNLFNTKRIFPNLALMKISAYYKKRGDKVEWYSPLFHDSYDLIFASKVFNWESPMDSYLKENITIGGSGYDLSIKLPDKIEHIYPDYELYHCKYALGFLTRGCIRNCSYCIVREKEGYIRKNADLEEFWAGQERIKLLDNNFLAYKDHIKELKHLIEIDKRIDFNQGLDIRLITEENAKHLSNIRKWNGIDYRFAFDFPSLEKIIRKKTRILRKNGINRGMFYVLIGYNTTPREDLRRIRILKELGHIAYIMPYDKKDPYQKVMRKYVNMHFSHVIDFETYLKRYGSMEQKEYCKKKAII